MSEPTVISLILKEISDIKATIAALDKKVDNLPDRMDKRYASKWTEKLMYSVVALVITGVGYALLHTVIPALTQNGSPAVGQR